MLFMVMVAVAIPSVLIMINFVMANLYENSRETPSPFECGFDASSPSRLPFSMRFFLITVIFLIFDVEITLILPTPVTLYESPLAASKTMVVGFIVILLGGLAHEWKNGALEWKL